MIARPHVSSPLSDYPPFGCGRAALEASDEEGSYALRFSTLVFKKFEELSFTSRGSARFN